MDGPSIRPLSDQGKGPAFEHQLDYWTEDNRDAKYPRLLEATSSLGFNHMTSDFWMINAGYLRLKNLQVGYNFSNDLLKIPDFLISVCISQQITCLRLVTLLLDMIRKRLMRLPIRCLELIHLV